MKSVFTAILLTFFTSFYAQITKNVGDFHKVTSFDKIDVVLVQSTESKVIVSGSDAESVEFVNNNGELKIRMPLDKILSGDTILVKVFYTKIDAIEANEGSRITAENTLTSSKFEIIAKEGSTINIDLQTKTLVSKISSGAEVDINGKATNHDAIVNAGGILNAKGLITAQTTITCNAGGEADVFATDYALAKVRAGGTILIYGNPKKLDQKVVLGGTIEKK